MPDDIDRAQERDLQYQADCELERQYLAARQAVDATGECLYCGEALADGLRFCNADCRDGWQHEQKLKRMQGVK